MCVALISHSTERMTEHTKKDYVKQLLDEIGLLNEPLQLELLAIAESDTQGRINRMMAFAKKLLNSDEFANDPEMLSFVNNLFDMIRLMKMISMA